MWSKPHHLDGPFRELRRIQNLFGGALSHPFTLSQPHQLDCPLWRHSLLNAFMWRKTSPRCRLRPILLTVAPRTPAKFNGQKRQESASFTRKVLQQFRCAICNCGGRLTALVGIWDLTVRVRASRQLSSEVPDGWRARILHVRVQLSSHPFYVVSLQVHQHTQIPVLQRCHRHDLDVARVHHLAAASLLPSPASTEGRTTRPWLGSSLACALVLLFRKGPRFTLLSSPLQSGRLVCKLIPRRAHSLSTSQPLALCLWSVRHQASDPSISSEESLPSVSGIHE